MKNLLGLAALALLSCGGQFPVDLTTQALSDVAPIGGFESVDSAGNVRGWALDPDSPASALTIQLYLDGDAGAGTALPPVVASQPRADINASTGFSGDHGFLATLPSSTHDGHSHYVYAYAVDAQTAAPARLPLTFVIAAPPACQPSCPPGNCGLPDGCGGTCGCPLGRICQYDNFCVHCPIGYQYCGSGQCARICP